MTTAAGSAALGALVLLPLGAGVLLLLGGRRGDRAAGPVAVAVAAAVVALAAASVVALAAGSAAARPELAAPFLGLVEGGELAVRVDGLSAVLILTVAVVAAAVTVFAVADLAADAARGRFFGLLLVFTAAMLTTVTATTLPTLLLAWEIMGATSYALIGFHWQVPGKLPAGTTAFLTTRAGDLGLYVAAGAALAGTGSLALDDLAGAVPGWRDVAAAGVLVAALGKSAQLPFSAWLSRAMEGPSPVSALLHSATMVAAGGYLLVRLQPLLAATEWAATATAWVGAATALLLGAVACAQRDLKQLLAASTAAQIGFVVLAAGVGATAGGAAHLMAHAAVKATLFIAAGAWLTSLGTKQLDGLRGAARRHRGIGAAAVVAALALAGVPPLSLWATKDEVIAGVDGVALHVVALAAAAVSAAYAGKILAVVLAAPAPAEALDREQALDREEPGTRRVPVAAATAAGVLAAAAAGLGVLALPAVAEWFRTVLDARGQPAPGAADLLLSGALALVVLAVVALRPRLLAATETTPLARWAGLGRLLSGRPVLRLAQAAARIDDGGLDRAVLAGPTALRRLAAALGGPGERAVDGGVEGLAAMTAHAGRTAARSDVRDVDGAVRGTVAGLRRAGALARRPQTGLLHQYYAQAVVGLAVLLVVLLVVR